MENQVITKTKSTTARKPADPAERVAQWYPDLRLMASRRLRGEALHRSFQTTELLHDTYVRLAEHGPNQYRDRSHFFASAKRAMNAAFIGQIRHRTAQKRGRGWIQVSLDGTVLPAESATHSDVQDTLQRFRRVDPRLAKVAELRFVQGHSVREIATMLRRSGSSIRRDCATAGAWLRRELRSGTTD